MDHFRLIKRAFNISWAYKALWVFGILLALTTGGGGGNGGGDNNTNFDFPRDRFPDIPSPQWPPQIPSAWIGIVIGIVCLIAVVAVAFTILRYVSNTALIRMVDGYESTGDKVTVGGGFRLGWSRGSFLSWVVGLLFGLLGLLVVILSLALVAAPQLLWLAGDNTLGTIAIVLSVGLFFLALIFWIVFFSVLSIVSELTNRAIILEGLGVMDGIRRGWRLFRARLGDNIIMGLILFGIRLVATILMIPVFFLLLLAGAVIGGLPGLLAGGITNIFVHGTTPQTVGLIVGGVILLLVLAIPLLILSGLWETFNSSTWTLTFRELLAPGLSAAGSTVPPVPAPVEPSPVV